MRYLFGFICVLALGVMPMVGCSDGGGSGGEGGSGPPLEFVAGQPVTVSGPTPFQGCGPISNEPFNPGAEVEPWIAVNPTNRNNLVGAWILDTGSRPYEWHRYGRDLRRWRDLGARSDSRFSLYWWRY